MIKCVVNTGLVVLKLIIHMNSTKCTKQSSPYSKSISHYILYVVLSFKKKKKRDPPQTTLKILLQFLGFQQWLP